MGVPRDKANPGGSAVRNRSTGDATAGKGLGQEVAPEAKMDAERIGARGAFTSKVAHIALSVKGFRGRARAYDAVGNVARNNV
jgi:hypothetical protein